MKASLVGARMVMLGVEERMSRKSGWEVRRVVNSLMLEVF